MTDPITPPAPASAGDTAPPPQRIVAFGARGYSTIILRDVLDHAPPAVQIAALLDEISNGFDHPQFGAPVISRATRRERFADLPVLVTVGSPALRQRIIADLLAEGAALGGSAFRQLGLIDPSATIGPGCVVGSPCRIGTDVRLGCGVLAIGSVIGHDSTIGDFSALGYRSMVLGHVEIGQGVTVAPGATIGNGTPGRPLRIGDGAVIGTGAVVHDDVPAGARMMGNPAMPVRAWVRLRRQMEAPRARPSRSR